MQVSSLTASLLVVAGDLTAALDATLSRHSVTLRQAAALRALAVRPGISYTELARECHVTKQSMQKTVRHLQRIGAVRRLGRPGSGRTACLHTTDHGKALIVLAEQALRTADARVVENLDRMQVATLSALLADLSTNAHRQAPGADATGQSASQAGA